MMSDVRRVLRLFPTTYYFRNSLVFSLLFVCLGFFMATTADELHDLSLVFFYCAFPVLMICSQTMRIDIPYLVRTSPHRRRMVTVVPVIFHVILTLVCWGLVLLVMKTAGPRCGLTPAYTLYYAVWFPFLCGIFGLTNAISLRVNGAAVVAFYVCLTTAILLVIFLFPRLIPRLTQSVSEASVTWVNAGSLSVIVLLITLLFAPVYYLVLRALSGRMINNMTMDRIK